MDNKCVLYDRDCIHCGECEFCDIDPTKICDNCGKCLDGYNRDYVTFKIDKIITEGEDDGHHCDDDECDCHQHHRR